MATKTANVMARVAPDVKAQAEAIMEQLGIPASVVINSLYKQIIMTRSIPFSLSLPREPISIEEMDEKAFNAMMEQGYQQALNGESRPIEEVFADIRKKM
jgi:addiction module RelB/DinJ family antitoxin